MHNPIFAFIISLLLCGFSLVASERNAPVLLVSFDGLRDDKLDLFLEQNPSSNFQKFIDEGVHADFMIPSFPSATFPNHWTIVTGLYPETHGIVSNTIYDPKYNAKVDLTKSAEPQYWNKSDPIWLTARRQGLKTGSSFWVGNNVWNRTPDIFLAYTTAYDPAERITELVSWLKKFGLDFANLYFDEPDSTGHREGPDGPAYMNKIKDMDQLLGHLMKELKNANLLDKMNIVIVSDHGMQLLDDNKIIDLSKHINVNLLDNDKSVFSSVSNLYPKSNSDISFLVQEMNKIPNLKAFEKGTVPSEYNYNNNDRIGPIVAIADPGFLIFPMNVSYTNKGNHGYNNTYPTMRSVFMARGPNFKPKTTISSIKNVNVYPLLCKLLDITCQANNGTTEVFNSVYIATSTTNDSKASMVFNINIGMILGIFNIFKYFH